MTIEIRKGTVADTEEFIRLLREAKDAMENQEWFFLDPPEDVRAQVHSGVMELWVAVDGDRLAGVFEFLRPGLACFN